MYSGEGVFTQDDYCIIYVENEKGGSKEDAVILDKYHAEYCQ